MKKIVCVAAFAVAALALAGCDDSNQSSQPHFALEGEGGGSHRATLTESQKKSGETNPGETKGGATQGGTIEAGTDAGFGAISG